MESGSEPIPSTSMAIHGHPTGSSATSQATPSTSTAPPLELMGVPLVLVQHQLERIVLLEMFKDNAGTEYHCLVGWLVFR